MSGALALQIERYYTKNQIMELYANHIFLGANAYGVEARRRDLFWQTSEDLTLGEAALLAECQKPERILADLQPLPGQGKA